MTRTKNIPQKDIQRRRKLRMLAINAMAVVGAAALFTLLGFANKHQKLTQCHKLEISIDTNNGESFIVEDQVRETVMNAEPQLLEKPTNEIDISLIHAALTQLGAIREAHVYMNADGRCIVRVKQRTPIARIITTDGQGFYLDTEGFTMPLSSNFTARVPVFVGNLRETLQSKSVVELAEDVQWSETSMLDDIYALTQFIDKNPFLKAQVDHVHIRTDRKIEIVPRVGNHRILIGTTKNLEAKFKKLMAFYAETVHKADLNDYSVINLEYAGQVVCVKK